MFCDNTRGSRQQFPPRQDAGFERSSICSNEMLQRYRSQDAGLILHFWVARTQAHSLSLGQFPVPHTVLLDSGLFLNFRLLRCRLVSLTSVLKDWDSDSVCCDISPPHSVCMYPNPDSSLPELHDSAHCGATSPDTSPVISSLSMGTKPRDAHGVLVSSDSYPDPPLNPTVELESDESCSTCLDHSGLEHMPSIANPFATSFPCTLTCAGTCSHLTSLPGFSISWSSISHTGMWTCTLPDDVVHPFDFQCCALPVAPNCRYWESVRIANLGTQVPCSALSAAQSSAPLCVCRWRVGT